jgi:ribonuclease inhibitor
MKKIEIDFENITTKEEFYEVFRSKIELPEYFGDNLDALWDVMTAYLELPLKVRFLNFNNKKLDFFVSLKELFNDAERELNGRLSFKILS